MKVRPGLKLAICRKVNVNTWNFHKEKW